MKKLIWVLVLMAMAVQVKAEVPKLINYSGKLTDKAGNILPDRVYNMKYILYDAQSGENEIWREEHLAPDNGIMTYGGGFNVILGGISPNPWPDFNQNYYIELQVYINDAWEVFGRQKILSVAYAQRAEYANQAVIANSVADNTVTGSKITDRQVGLADMDMNAVMPVGSIIAWHKTVCGYLPPNWVECNGGTLTDPESPINGTSIPNLNGEGRFLRGSTVSGTLQADELKSHTHTTIASNLVEPKNEWHVHADWANASEGPTEATTSTGGSETRPVNMSVVWIIKIK
jgi:hypothetical protein